ncbi:MAG: hypothetical protein GEU73_10315 [Chloroflexi bacterium]|nr:hypothetical protein [Chloroflexota bacterium]
MTDFTRSALYRPGARPAAVRSPLGPSRGWSAQRPAASYAERLHNPLDQTESIVYRTLVETWGWG